MPPKTLPESLPSITAARPFCYLMGFIALFLSGCSEVWNSPHPAETGNEVIYQGNFQLPPKHLDPAISYSTDESLLIDQIYEPPLGYHFLKRPYELEPLLAEDFPEIVYLDSHRQPVAGNSQEIAFTQYTFTLRQGVLYQPHPAFSQSSNGHYLYQFTSGEQSRHYTTITDFPVTSTRELVADDFLYQIKRLADPENKAPLIGFLAEYILGMADFTEQLRLIRQEQNRENWLDLRNYPMSGLKKLGKYQYSITIKGLYPQFLFWQAMHFFAPVPWEADRFYHNPGFREKNLTLDWYPVGTGAFMMTRNNPNRQIVLERNPNFRDEFYPFKGEESDASSGYLEDAGKKLPFIDKAVFSLEKESLPLWAKFLQGYYDRSGDNHGNVVQNLDQALVVGPNGLELSSEMADKNITLTEEIKPALYYNGFNMLDPVVGGYGEPQQKLRQAIAIAWNMEEYIDIFINGAALPYMGPIPPGIDGSGNGAAAINPHTHEWRNARPVRKSLDTARQLMMEAGYPGGRDQQTGKPLKLYFDVQAQASTNSTQDWQKRQLEKLGIQLEFRATDWNRYREKIRNGNHQLFQFGWLGDYPAPENFLFLLHGPQSPLKCQCDGNNSANYNNPDYDRLFEKMRTLPQGPERSALIQEMMAIVRKDTPWFTGYYPKEYYLNHQWLFNTKRHGISKSTLKYLRIDPERREQKQQQWNQPKLWPLLLIFLGLITLVIPAAMGLHKRQQQTIAVDSSNPLNQPKKHRQEAN